MDDTEKTAPKAQPCLGMWCKKTVQAGVSLVLVFLIFAFVGVIWVATGPRSLKQFTPQITEKINAQLGEYNIAIDDILLTWDGWQSPLDARFDGVRLLSQHNLPSIKLKEVAVSADIWSLLIGRVVLDGITLFEPTINLYRRADGEFILDLGNGAPHGPELPSTVKQEAKTLGYYLEKVNMPDLLGLEEVNIRGGNINIGDTQTGIIARLAQVNLESRIGDNVEVALSTQLIGRGTKLAPISANITIPKDSLALAINASFEHIEPSLLQKIKPDLDFLEAAQFSLNGNVDLSLNSNASIRQATFDVTTSAGKFESKLFKKHLDISEARLRGYIPSKGIVVLDEVLLETKDLTLSGNAKLSQNDQDQLGIEGLISLSNVTADHVDSYWPIAQSPVSRDWVVSNLTGGKLLNTSLKLDIKPGMLEADRMPNEAVDAVIDFVDMDVRFLPEFEKITNAKGRININANELRVTIDTADFLDKTELSKGDVLIDDLNVDNPNILIGLFIESPASEVVEILGHPLLDVAEDIGADAATIKGKMFGRLELDFPFTLPRGADGRPTDDAYKYRARVTLVDVTQPKFFGEYDIAKTSGELEATEKAVEFEGVGDVFGVPLQVDVLHRLRGRYGTRTEIKAAGNVDNTFLQRFDVDIEEYVQGSIGATAVIKLQDNDTIRVSAKTDLTNAVAKVKELGWKKEVGTAATLEFVAEDSEKQTRILSAHFKSATDAFEGSLVVGKDGVLEQIIASKLKLGEHELKLSYAPIAGGYKIYAQGDYFDASGFFDDNDEPFSFKEIPALDVQLDLKRLVLDDGRYIDDLNGRASCTPLICESVEVSGHVQGSSPVVMRIHRVNNKRRFSLTSDDAGSLLRGLDVYENMQNGQINIDGEWDDSDPDRPLVGRLHLWDFQVRKTPILARIVSLASFGGLVDALQGNGLVFKKMATDFTLQNDIITVKDLKARGDSIGITANGNVNLLKDTLTLKGVVIPSYAINSFLKNVPIVGAILTDGEAIIAAHYKVDDKMDDPEVSVNPLSALAPGFLRRIFE